MSHSRHLADVRGAWIHNICPCVRPRRSPPFPARLCVPCGRSCGCSSVPGCRCCDRLVLQKNGPGSLRCSGARRPGQGPLVPDPSTAISTGPQVERPRHTAAMGRRPQRRSRLDWWRVSSCGSSLTLLTRSTTVAPGRDRLVSAEAKARPLQLRGRGRPVTRGSAGGDGRHRLAGGLRRDASRLSGG